MFAVPPNKTVATVASLSMVLLAAGPLAARPITLEPASSFSNPDPAWTGFGAAIGVDGNYAIATAQRLVLNEPNGPDYWRITAFLFERTSAGWRLVRQLGEYDDDPDFEIPPAVAMQNGIAAVQTVRTDFWELGPGGWTLAPSAVVRDGPGRHLKIDGGRVISGDSTGSWSGRVFEKDAAGTWQTAAVLRGNTRFDGSDDEFRGGPADISGDWGVLFQYDNADSRDPEALVFNRRSDGWYLLPYGSARPPEGAERFGPEVAIRWPDILVSGGSESGTYVFREQPAMGFHLATRIQALDSYMGSGAAGAFAKAGTDLILQYAWSHDRGAGVINVFQRRENGSYGHVAVLAPRNGEQLSPILAASGRRVLVRSGAAPTRVYHFELPENLAAPARIQDTFASGDGTGWSTSPGSAFGTAPRGITRVYRQTNINVDARAVLAAGNFTSQAVEADVRIIQFGSGASSVGLVTRYQSPENFFEARLGNNGRVEIHRMASGTRRVLASAAFSALRATLYRVRFESVGTLHRVFVNGTLLADADAGGPTAGRAALVTTRAQAEFDNVVVSPTLNTTIYATDFEGGVPGPWTHSGPALWTLWAGASTVYNQSSVLGDARATIGVPADDQIVRVRARLDTFATPTGSQERWFGVMARYVDDSNYYYLTLRSSNTVSLRKVVNGSIVTLASAPLAVSPARWYQLRLDAVGSSLRAYVDGVLALEASDGSHASGTSGPVMFKAAVDYDDFSVVQP